VRRAAMVARVLAVVAALGVLVALAGCDADWYEDDWDDDYDDGSSYDKTVYFYLNVADEDGDPLQNVTVWIDGTRQDDKTEDEYERLGNQFPPDWRGWRYNWSGGPFWFDVRGCSGGTCSIEIMVSRSGYQTQRSHVPFDRWDPREIYVRQTFVMEPRSGVAAAEVVTAPQPPEKCSLSE